MKRKVFLFESNFWNYLHCYINLNLSGILSDIGNHHESLRVAKVAVNYSQELLLQMKNDCKEKEEMIEAVCISYHTIGSQEEFLKNYQIAYEWYTKAYKFGERNLGENKSELKEILHASLINAEKKLKSQNGSKINAIRLFDNANHYLKSKKLRVNSASKTSLVSSKYESKIIIRKSTPSHKLFNPKIITSKTKTIKSANVKKFSNISKTPKENLKIVESQNPTPFDPSEHENILDNLNPNCKPLSSDYHSSENSFGSFPNAEPEHNNVDLKLEKLATTKFHQNISSIAIQTDKFPEAVPEIHNKLQEMEAEDIKRSDHSLEDSFHEKKSVKMTAPYSMPETKSKNLHQALVKSYKIDICQKEYNIKYFINSSLDMLYMMIDNNFENYELHYPTNPDDPILDTIYDRLHPCIDIVSNQLILTEKSTNVIFKGLMILKNLEYFITIHQSSPRCNILINFQLNDKTIQKKLDFFDIKDFFSENGLEKKILISSLYIDDNNIKIKIPKYKTLNPLQGLVKCLKEEEIMALIYYKSHKFNNSMYYLKISEINYEKNANYKYLTVLDSKGRGVCNNYHDLAWN